MQYVKTGIKVHVRVLQVLLLLRYHCLWSFHTKTCVLFQLYDPVMQEE